ncbi:hypothetical protein N8886_00780 [Candidatus Pelagibacter ubique]|nr:hypothetical protein [Candidatus Pelagibacter ubique]
MKNKYILSFFILIIILFFSSFVSAAITKQELPSVLSKEEFEKWSANPKAPFIYINKIQYQKSDGEWSGNYDKFTTYCVKAKLDDDQRTEIFVDELYYVLQNFIEKLLNFYDEEKLPGTLWNNSSRTLFSMDDHENCGKYYDPAFALVQFQHGKDYLKKYEGKFWVVGLVTPDEFKSLEQKVDKILEFKDHLDLNDYEYKVFRANEITSINDYENLKTEMYSSEFNNYLKKNQVVFQNTVEKDKLQFYLRLKQFAKKHSYTNTNKEYVKMSWQYYLSKEGVNMLPYKDGSINGNGRYYLEDVDGPFLKTDDLGRRQRVIECNYENGESYSIGANLKTCSPYVR